MFNDKTQEYGGKAAGYLWNFKINSDSLTPSHANGLQALMKVFNRQLMSYKKPTVWLHGFASRTGSYSYNYRLSKSREKSVREFLYPLRDSGYVEFRTQAWGEMFWWIKRIDDGHEDAFHRGVLVLTGDAAPQPPTPKVKPNEKPRGPVSLAPRCLVDGEIDFYERAKVAWSLSLGFGFKDTGGGRHATPSPKQITAAFANWRRQGGWTWRELVKEFPFALKANLEDAAGMPMKLDRELAHLRKMRASSREGDPEGICATSRFNPARTPKMRDPTRSTGGQQF
jgi:hypothetical protein